jgi:hypothetical protein
LLPSQGGFIELLVFLDKRLIDILQEVCTPLIQSHHPVDLGITHFRRDGTLDSDSQFGGQWMNELEQFCGLFSRICLHLECSQLSELCPRLKRSSTAVGLVATRCGEPFSVGGFAVRDRKVVAIDILADPARLRQLDLTILDNKLSPRSRRLLGVVRP